MRPTRDTRAGAVGAVVADRLDQLRTGELEPCISSLLTGAGKLSPTELQLLLPTRRHEGSSHRGLALMVAKHQSDPSLNKALSSDKREREGYRPPITYTAIIASVVKKLAEPDMDMEKARDVGKRLWSARGDRELILPSGQTAPWHQQSWYSNNAPDTTLELARCLRNFIPDPVMASDTRLATGDLAAVKSGAHLGALLRSFEMASGRTSMGPVAYTLPEMAKAISGDEDRDMHIFVAMCKEFYNIRSFDVMRSFLDACREVFPKEKHIDLTLAIAQSFLHCPPDDCWWIVPLCDDLLSYDKPLALAGQTVASQMILHPYADMATGVNALQSLLQATQSAHTTEVWNDLASVPDRLDQLWTAKNVYGVPLLTPQDQEQPVQALAQHASDAPPPDGGNALRQAVDAERARRSAALQAVPTADAPPLATAPTPATAD